MKNLQKDVRMSIIMILVINKSQILKYTTCWKIMTLVMASTFSGGNRRYMTSLLGSHGQEFLKNKKSEKVEIDRIED